MPFGGWVPPSGPLLPSMLTEEKAQGWGCGYRSHETTPTPASLPWPILAMMSDQLNGVHGVGGGGGRLSSYSPPGGPSRAQLFVAAVVAAVL